MNLKLPSYFWILIGVLIGFCLCLLYVWLKLLDINQDTICFSKDIGEYLIRKELGI